MNLHLRNSVTDRSTKSEVCIVRFAHKATVERLLRQVFEYSMQSTRFDYISHATKLYTSHGIQGSPTKSVQCPACAVAANVTIFFKLSFVSHTARTCTYASVFASTYNAVKDVTQWLLTLAHKPLAVSHNAIQDVLDITGSTPMQVCVVWNSCLLTKAHLDDTIYKSCALLSVQYTH